MTRRCGEARPGPPGADGRPPTRGRDGRAPGRRAVALAALAVLATACQTPQWPVGGRLTSPYGLRMEGALPDMHRGVDIAAALGTPVRPLLPGRVRYAGPMEGYGHVVWVDHRDDLLTVYAHLSETSVADGQEVGMDTVIGLIGQSGTASGPHLHFEVWRWGREVDPVRLMGRPPSG